MARGKIKVLTLAAELKDADKLIEYASKQGTVVALGHQLATKEQIEKAQQMGATFLTHLGNGVPLLLHRHNNPIWEGCANDELGATIIADGFHLSDSVLKTIIRAKSVDRISIVSDMAPICGNPPGEYECFGSQVVLEWNGRIKQKEKDNLAGSAVTILDSMNYLASHFNYLLTLEDFIKLGVTNPLAFLNLSYSDYLKTLTQNITSNLMFSTKENKFYFTETN